MTEICQDPALAMEETAPPSALARVEGACSSSRQLTGSSCRTAIPRCIYSTMKMRSHGHGCV